MLCLETSQVMFFESDLQNGDGDGTLCERMRMLRVSEKESLVFERLRVRCVRE
jgi:hypothetical protein